MFRANQAYRMPSISGLFPLMPASQVIRGGYNDTRGDDLAAAAARFGALF